MSKNFKIIYEKENIKFNIEINESDIIFDLKKIININIKGAIPISQIGLFFYHDKNKKLKQNISLTNNSLSLFNEYPKIKEIDKIYLYDTGKQIEIITGNIIEYLGPIITFFIYTSYYGFTNFSKVQYFSFIMSNFHFLKRIFESINIHIHTKTMELKMLIIECIYYIIYYGIFCEYYLFNNKNLKWESKIHLGWFIIFFFCEINNFICHVYLRNIRISNPGEIKIPEGNLFSYICCANYFWEIGSWICISFFTKLKCIMFFTFMGAFVMSAWAIEKKQMYVKKFNLKDKKAIIPFIF